MTRIVLIGFMGAGKTTLGKALAGNLKMQFIDLDAYIENRVRKNISQIFREQGEQGFRDLERRLLHEAAEFEDVVISAGGGTPCFYDNMDYMNRQAITVYMNASRDVLFRRLRVGKAKRPLLKEKNDEEIRQFISDTLQNRESYYLKAKEIFCSDCLENVKQIARSVEELKKQLNLIS